MGDLPLLVDGAWLESELGAPDLRIVDATWYLPSEGRDAAAEYACGHVPGAVHLDLSRDLSDRSSGLRNTVASPEALAARFGLAGIGSGHRVVVYDRRGGYSAARVWWTLRYVGHARAALLQGGYGLWQQEGRPTTSELPAPVPAQLDPKPEPRWLRSKGDVLRILAAGGAQLVDARAPARFRGEGAEAARRAGHIPRSINVPYGDHWVGDPPRFREAAELRGHYEACGVRFDAPVVTTCGSGVTAALAAFALTWLGHPDVAVYDGSWDEWGNAPDTPVERG